MNFRARVATLCGLFLAPLLLLLALQAQRTWSDVSFLRREIEDVATLRAIWPEVRLQGDADADQRAAVERVLSVTRSVVLDSYPDTYPLADALTSDLLLLSLGARDGTGEQGRLARKAAMDLSEAAGRLPHGPLRTRLEARADRLDQLITAPAAVAADESAGLWGDTAGDLADLLARRQAAMLRAVALGAVLIGGFVALGGWLAMAMARDMGRRVTLLVGQIDRLIDNDTQGTTPFLDDRHDMGRIAKGIDALRLSLIDARAAWSQVLLNEMRATLLSDHSRALVLRTDREGRVIFTSPASPEMAFDPEELEGAPVWDLFEPGDREELSHATPKAAGEVVSRRRRRLARRFGATELWDVEISLPEEANEGFVFLLRPAAS